MHKRLFINLFALIVITLSTSISFSQQFETIYGRKANVSKLAEILKIKDLKQVVAEMQKTDVKIFKVIDHSPEVQKKERPFKFLSEVPEGLKESLHSYIEETKDEAAIFVSWNEFGSKSTNVILVSEASHPTTLFHEFSHHLFEIQNRNDTLRISEEQKKNGEFLYIYNRRTNAALFNEASFIQRSWRENFDGYVNDYSKVFDSAQGQLKSEEVAIEVGLLKLMLETRSPHFKLSRAREGIFGYSQQVIVSGTVSLIQQVMAFMSLIKTAAHQPGSDITTEEERLRDEFNAPIYQRLEFYLKNRISPMQQQIDAAKKIILNLETIK